ncbi:MAG: 4Fe-4S binding protein, partial [Candidatus Cloacimonetes bacterium]|nr:4Fe-4S binding protein [Candidatus Cloacimonadota bacterium]
MIEVINDKCIGCSLCVKSCAYEAITITDKLAEINIDKCVLCGACVQACPFDAIIIRRQAAEKIDKSVFQGIWVYAEQRDGIIAPVVLELLGKARELADDIEAELSAVLLGSEIEHLTADLIAYGADKVILVDDPALKHFQDEQYAKALSFLIDKHKPSIVLAGATVIGRSFIP